MKVGMKNAIELLGDLHEYFDFAINEECHQWNECGVSVSLDASLPKLESSWPSLKYSHDVEEPFSCFGCDATDHHQVYHNSTSYHVGTPPACSFRF